MCQPPPASRHRRPHRRESVFREQLRGRRLRFTDDQRRRLARNGRLLARRVLDSLNRLGAREIHEETTTEAAGLAGRGCESRLDKPASRTADATEDLTHVLPDCHQHGCQ